MIFLLEADFNALHKIVFNNRLILILEYTNNISFRAYRREKNTSSNISSIKEEVNFYNEYYYRLDFYSDWLERINNKHNYIGVNNAT